MWLRLTFQACLVSVLQCLMKERRWQSFLSWRWQVPCVLALYLTAYGHRLFLFLGLGWSSWLTGSLVGLVVRRPP